MNTLIGTRYREVNRHSSFGEFAVEKNAYNKHKCNDKLP